MRRDAGSAGVQHALVLAVSLVLVSVISWLVRSAVLALLPDPATLLGPR